MQVMKVKVVLTRQWWSDQVKSCNKHRLAVSFWSCVAFVGLVSQSCVCVCVCVRNINVFITDGALSKSAILCPLIMIPMTVMVKNQYALLSVSSDINPPCDCHMHPTCIPHPPHTCREYLWWYLAPPSWMWLTSCRLELACSPSCSWSELLVPCWAQWALECSWTTSSGCPTHSFVSF